ncbi:M20 family metallopeptidase [Candidatus Roizmanbacteria bacterium]|nr:M20 family metallopeptidase [Candidatus Roizmanbacteria bacterium]
MGKLEALTKQLISIPSPYPNEMKLANFIKTFFKQKGYKVFEQKVEDNRSNIIVEKGSGKKTILLYSHLDTVGIVDGWKTNPLRPVVIGDKLFGLGSYDMKGGMAVNINTFLEHEAKNIKLRLLFCIDEENISKGGYVFANSSFMKDVDCVLSPEPAFAHGVNGIVTGRIGRAVIQVKLTYPSQHFYFYNPQNDINIVSALVIQKLKQIYKKNGDAKEFAFVRSLQSQSVGMSTPQEVFIELDTSVLPPKTNKDMLASVTQIISKITQAHNVKYEVNFKKRETPFLSGYKLSENNKYLKQLSQSIISVTGKKAVPYFRSSVADENIFGALGKTVLGIGPEGDSAHGANEWVSVSLLTRLQDIYLNFLSHL